MGWAFHARFARSSVRTKAGLGSGLTTDVLLAKSRARRRLLSVNERPAPALRAPSQSRAMGPIVSHVREEAYVRYVRMFELI
jgi:hypothetical protein